MCNVGLKCTLLDLHLFSDLVDFVLISWNYMIFPTAMKWSIHQPKWNYFLDSLCHSVGGHKLSKWVVTSLATFPCNSWECRCWHRDTLATKWCQSISTVHARSELTSPVSNHPGSQSACRSAAILEFQLILTTLHTLKTLPSLICGTLRRILT